jgi:LPS export ABC transporter protein LptC
MLKKFVAVSIFILLVNHPALAKQGQAALNSDQQINEFSLAGYGERGKKTWEISGKSADIFTDVIKLKDIIGNLYGEKDNVRLVADRGDFNKADNNVHLQQNVVVTTSSGAKLTTDSLDWDRKNNLISTKDEVNIERENMITTAIGAHAEPGLNKVTLEKNVNVQMVSQESRNQNAEAGINRIIITCDGQLNIDYAKNIATFNKNVKVDREGSQIYSDVMDIYFISEKNTGAAKSKDKEDLGMSGRIDRIIAHGNVKIVRGRNVSYSDEAIYSAADKKITLTGRPKLIIESTEDFKNAPVGN